MVTREGMSSARTMLHTPGKETKASLSSELEASELEDQVE
jgi:hypothetical protein